MIFITPFLICFLIFCLYKYRQRKKMIRAVAACIYPGEQIE